ncbi:hypothetical protein [Kribbella sp. NPDC050459]|jgi:hypothetical protein|uniref:hypothetical protein n=1 Tax=Kribbella sp. NPDC050459 TaxID=3155785 RepID=UPI0033D54EF9
MRQSLSESRTALLAVGLSLVLAVVAIVDQSGGRSLFDHAASVYAPYGKTITSGTVYGVVYAVAVVNALIWLAVVAVARRPRPVVIGVAVLAVLLTLGAGLTLLFVTEYGVHPFPPLWGVLALLPVLAGAVVLLRRR